MQPVVIDKCGVPRFKENAVVVKLKEEAAKRGFNLNHLIGFGHEFPQADLEQFYQLIGYSVGGYCELSHVGDESADAAVEEVRRLGFPWQQGVEAVQKWNLENGYPIA